MVEQKIISQLARKLKVSDRQIEKDYVLTWILKAISLNKNLEDILVFKGGTVLKKAYFEDYRFSEDLDFTLIDEKISNESILMEFQDIFHRVKRESNIDLLIDSKSTFFNDLGSMQFYIDYAASLKGGMGTRDLKIDITRGEHLETDYELRSIFSYYPDVSKFTLKCYSLVEVLIEKMSALMSRTEPRDLYDFWYLTEVFGININENKHLFVNKAIRKNLDPDKFGNKVLSKELIFKRDWKTKLINQIHDLPDFDRVFRSVKRKLKI